MYDYPPRDSAGRSIWPADHDIPQTDGCPKYVARPYPIAVDPGAPPEVEDLRHGSVRIRAPFSPTLPMRMSRAKDASKWITPANDCFDIFITLPVRMLADPTERVAHVLIMFNGLNEIMPWHSRLYDDLGHALAERGIVSVLLPTPYHLNRTPQSTLEETSVSALLKRPTTTEFAAAPYANFEQSFREIDFLRSLIGPSEPHHANNKYGLFDRFDAGTRVSLFGFSMGGLRALSKFVIDHESFHRCVLLNSGCVLPMLRPPRLEDHEWEGFVSRARNVDADQLKDFSNEPARMQLLLHDAFFDVESLGIIDRELDACPERIKVILGTKDRAITSGSLTRLKHLVNIETVEGMGHVVSTDPSFEANFDRLVEGIARFIVDEPQCPLSRHDVHDQLVSALQLAGQSSRPSEEEIRKLAEENPEVRRLYIASKARFEGDAALADLMARNWPPQSKAK